MSAKLSKLKKRRRHQSSQPSAGISPEKAKEILRHGSVQGHKLTPAQRRMFGAAAGRA